MTSDENFGLHFVGPSSVGKTITLDVAGSVWGGCNTRGYKTRWRATVNGLEALAVKHHDTLLTLDELAEVSPRSAGVAAYMLANGTGKARGDRDGRLREPAEWRLVFLSAGEIDLVTHLESEGLRVQAGQQIRLLSIDADVGNQLGVFENIHDFASSSEFAEHLRFNALRYYGAPIRAFLSQLTALDKAQEKIQKYKADFRKNFEKPRYQGYLVIDSQPAKRWGIRDQDGHLPRKPLKGRKKIDEKSARIIPVIDEQLWKDLVILYNETLLQHKQKLWGEDLKNYLLFPTINSTSSSVLYRAFMKLQLRYRSWHCLRHTRATLLIGQTGDFLLTRMWLGHKKQEILERYIHVYQAIVRNAKKKATKNPRPLKF